MKTVGLLNKKKEVRRIIEVDEKNAERLVSSKLAIYISDESAINKSKNFMDMRGADSRSKKTKYSKDAE